MSLSKQDREQDKSRTLQLMLAEVGQHPVSAVFMDIAKPPLSGVLPTSLVELKREGYVASPFHGHFVLTGRGWLRAMVENGTTDNPEFKQNLGMLMAVLKEEVKGRERDGMLTIETTAERTKLPQSFIFNVIESGAIELLFRVHGATWYRAFKGKMIHVSSLFGLDR